MSENVQLFEKTIENENDALNTIVAFINLAQSRGAFTIQESAKIWECVKQFQQKKQQNYDDDDV